MKCIFRCIFGVSVTLLVHSLSWSQAAPENWLVPESTTITRDAHSLSILSDALVAMNPASAPRVTDISVLYHVSKWSGKAVDGVSNESTVGFSAHSRSITVGNHVVSHTLSRNGTRTSESDDRVSRSVSDRRAIELLPYQPISLLQEVLLNPSDAIRALPSSSDPSGENGVEVTVRGPNWGPEQRDLTSASFDLYFSQDTHLLSRIVGVQHIDGHPMHLIPYSILYSDYQQFQALLLPRSIDERIAGRSTNVLSVAGVAINQGITSQSLQ